MEEGIAEQREHNKRCKRSHQKNKESMKEEHKKGKDPWQRITSKTLEL